MIFEENVEGEDFFEIILKEWELEKISHKGLVRIFPCALHEERDLNVFIRTEKEEIMPLVKGKKASTAKGFSENVKNEMKFGGKPQKQAVAIAYSEARQGKKKGSKEKN